MKKNDKNVCKNNNEEKCAKITIQWYPGHMAKTKRQIKENVDLIDIVYEVIDSRIPLSSKNKDIDGMIKNKPRILIMTKYDLCDVEQTKKWKEHYESLGYKVVTVDLLKDGIVTKFIFSEKEDILQLSYNNKYNKERVKLYKSDDGSLIKTELDNMFPEDKCNISNGMFEKDVFKFKVTASQGQEDLNGDYILDLKNLEINKL